MKPTGLQAATPTKIEQLMDRAWPAPDCQAVGDWVLRAAGGVTQRANSVWPRQPAADPEEILQAALQWYRSRRLPLIFQVFDDDRSAWLNAVLDTHCFTKQSETVIMALPRFDKAISLKSGLGLGLDGDVAVYADVEILEEPSEEWLAVWWAVDGRGGPAERDIAHAILTGCPALYALVRDDDGDPAAVGRLALVDGWGGLYCMATLPERRRRGYAAKILDSFLAEGARRRLDGLWLLVTAPNGGAQALYQRSCFEVVGRYLYRQAPLRRSPSGC
ncbi:N-acetyltransferase [Arthrobacter sp. ISL-30]|uniref:GNAT family N-acetyltransferase n=1 Tax=Arthrobacter sp. ISL-30 TaxID=2819109 RepID=UPI001BEB3CA3|nr:GNAT family N-acetyltransferase [Arthrobacter sp. ISL-30]MBT2512705.1 GNAT family N-acetyltransferase [Arthrobacter sp. ISL-30]